MLRCPVIPAAHIVGVLLVKGADLEVFVIKVPDKLCIFDDQQEFGRSLFQGICQAFLIVLGEILTLVIGEVCVIGGIQE